MGRPRTTECANGHKRTPESTRIARDGSQACRICDRERHRERQSALNGKAAMVTDTLEVTAEALALLQAQYAENPADYQLGRQVGALTNRLIALKRSAQPKPVYVRQPPTVVFTDAQWANSLPAHCPICHGEGHGHFAFDRPLPARGYATRYGNTSSKCLICGGTFDHREAK